jgi:phosphoribosylformimino-5-aminoimidazole carboxamide ribotide isomerase
MEFRPCIDIHNGKVKQIVGSSLKDAGSSASENFVSARNADYFAGLYRDHGIRGGHVIMLNPPGSEYYEATREQAISALRAYPGGLQIGGGITADNAASFIKEGAAAVIVTSYVFWDGKIDYDNLSRLKEAVGKEHLVLDLSCRYREEPGKESGYYIVTDRWQKFTGERVSGELLDDLSRSCSEFLIHAVDVEGKSGGIEENLAELLGSREGIPVTYAGGVHSFDDLKKLRALGRGRLNVTIGSALDLFGGPMSFETVNEFCKETSK